MKAIILIGFALSSGTLFAQQSFYDVTSGTGNGLRFWQSDQYKIHMGNAAEYHYGPVTDYSIKMNMSNTTGRGWTWGVVGLNPIAAIGINGDMQIEGSFVTLSSLGIGTSSPNAALQFGNALTKRKIVLYEELDNDHDFYGFGVTSGVGLTYQIGSSSNSHVFYAGASATTSSELMRIAGNGNVGIGTSNPSDKVHVFSSGSGGTSHYMSDLLIEDFDRGMVQILTGQGGTGYFAFGDEHDDFVGGVQYEHSGDRMVFRVNNHTADVVINSNGSLGIGTTDTHGFKLAIAGNAVAEGVVVQVEANWPDYVFEKQYKLSSLFELEQYIKANKHLPDVPTAEDVKANGLSLGEMNALLLKKVEELTLHLIAMKKEIDSLKKESDSNFK